MRLDLGHSNLVAAVHAPFDSSGEVAYSLVEKQAELLLNDRVSTVFVNGTTGECTSLTVPERLALAERWFEVSRGTPLKVIVHVGSNCLKDCQELASHAQTHGALAISAFAPSYFKPASLESLQEWCAGIIRSAAVTPFYFYDIPQMTGVKLDIAAFLEQSADRFPSLVGVKFSHSDLVLLQSCMAVHQQRFEVLFGVDEMLLSALVLGVRGAVGSTYNLIAPLYHRLIQAFEQHDFVTARQLQYKSVRLVQLLSKRGFMASAKAMMAFRGVDVGSPRPPHSLLSDSQRQDLFHDLMNEGFL